MIKFMCDSCGNHFNQNMQYRLNLRSIPDVIWKETDQRIVWSRALDFCGSDCLINYLDKRPELRNGGNKINV